MQGHGVVKMCGNFRGVQSHCNTNSLIPSHSLHIRSVGVYSL